MVEEHPKNLSLLTSPRSVLSEKKQITITNNGCNLLLRQKNRHDHVKYVCMTWQLWCNATYHNIKRNRNSDTHIYGSSCVTTWYFNYWLAWQNKWWVSYGKIKWSGENIISISHMLHILLIRCNANYHDITWCEMQTVVWMAYSDSTHFSNKLSYKTLFISNYGLGDMN
jgi:hypothetical protein